ncbi:DUF4349 domain-containing protein [Paenibacillus sanguinis]|uniref:DUF4349 domain-containing protein n=1 Tax=Paenibacillus sanguinis TaxID=225906 RepID=UPI00037A0532|nr:DUF4349 domain-containing protein [Paenibacillus sanguinis]
MKGWIRKVSGCTVIVLFVLLLGGCGGASNDFKAESSAENRGMPAADMANEGSNLNEESLASTGQANDSGHATGGGAEAAAVGQGVAGIQSQNATLDAGLPKKLIYRASVVMEVADYAKTQTEIRNLIAVSGGYLVEWDEDQSRYELGGNFVLKVPADGFSTFLDRLEQLEPKSMQRNIQGQDVSEQYVDLESRLKVKEATEARYLKFMEAATQSKQLVEYVNELERIQTDIEQIKGKMRYIDSNVAYSTIEIRVFQPDAAKLAMMGEKPGLPERMKNALNGSIEMLSSLGQWLIVFLAGVLPLLVIASIILVPVCLYRRKTREQRAQRRATRFTSNRRSLTPYSDLGKPEKAADLGTEQEELPLNESKADLKDESEGKPE